MVPNTSCSLLIDCVLSKSEKNLVVFFHFPKRKKLTTHVQEHKMILERNSHFSNNDITTYSQNLKTLIRKLPTFNLLLCLICPLSLCVSRWVQREKGTYIHAPISLNFTSTPRADFIFPIFGMRKLRLHEIKFLALGHTTAREW